VNIHVHYFAGAREAAGREGETLDLAAGCDVAALLARLIELHPDLSHVATSLRFAVGEAFQSPDATLTDGDRVALIPPVGGG
jgi:molybdopterin converting factor subunit 1